jgi:hypothetical protein
MELSAISLQDPGAIEAAVAAFARSVRALAVLRLITSSYLVGFCTGRADFAPLNTISCAMIQRGGIRKLSRGRTQPKYPSQSDKSMSISRNSLDAIVPKYSHHVL